MLFIIEFTKLIMNLRKIIGLSKSIIFGIFFIPHLILSGRNRLIRSDVDAMEQQIEIKLPKIIQLLFLLCNNRYFRNIFYHRLGPVKSSFLKWYMPGDRYFNISATTRIGPSMWVAHPFSTIINAESIGSNFRCLHCTTIGAKKGRPTLGNNVFLGANVIIIGDIHIGNNVIIGAGSVVVKDVPDNCVVAGNPAKIIKIIS